MKIRTDLADAAREGAPQVWPEASGNVCFDWEIGDAAATDSGELTVASAPELVEDLIHRIDRAARHPGRGFGAGAVRAGAMSAERQSSPGGRGGSRQPRDNQPSARQPMSRRQKPPGHSMRSTAS